MLMLQKMCDFPLLSVKDISINVFILIVSLLPSNHCGLILNIYIWRLYEKNIYIYRLYYLTSEFKGTLWLHKSLCQG